VKKIVRIIVYEIGIQVLVTFLYAIPFLTACSFIYGWPSSFQFILKVFSVIEFGTLSYIIADMASRGE
jgi:hypothetical protein